MTDFKLYVGQLGPQKLSGQSYKTKSPMMNIKQKQPVDTVSSVHACANCHIELKCLRQVS